MLNKYIFLYSYRVCYSIHIFVSLKDQFIHVVCLGFFFSLIIFHVILQYLYGRRGQSRPQTEEAINKTLTLFNQHQSLVLHCRRFKLQTCVDNVSEQGAPPLFIPFIVILGQITPSHTLVEGAVSGGAGHNRASRGCVCSTLIGHCASLCCYYNYTIY